MANIKICDELQIGKKSPNIDARYGPWLSKGEAVTTLSKWGTIAKGLTVGIIENNKIVEYWFQGGTDLDHLILKNNGGGGSGSIEGAELQANKVTSIRTGINEPEDSPTAPSDDKYPSEKAVALLYDNLETDVAETNRKIGDLSHFQDNQDYNPDPDNLNIGDILKGLETKIVEFNWALEGTDADKDSNVFNNTPYSGYSVWKVLGELYNAVQKKKYNVSFTVTNGSKDPDNNYTNVPEGDTIEWVVTPYVNYKMPSRIDGAIIEDLNNGTYKVTVSDILEDTEIICECMPIEQPVTTHNVTISVNNGTINGESQKVFHVEHNSGISCVLEANEYYHIPTSLPYSHMSISDTGILSITNITADIEITIDCVKNKYTVTLNISNGTTTSDNPQLVDAFGSAVFNLTADQYYELPAKTSNNIAIVNGVLTVNNITSDQTISVVCKPKDCFVVFNLDGGTGDTPGALHVDANTSIPLPIYNGTKDGYSLTDSDNRSYWIIVDTAGAHEVQMGGDYTIISDTTIKPKWLTSNNVTVTFDMLNPEYENPESVTVEKNTTITLPFPGGPYTIVKAIDDKNTLCIINWSEVQSNSPYVRPYYLPGASYTATKNITLYAATSVMWNPDLQIYAYAEPGDGSGQADIKEYPMFHSNYTIPQCTFTPPNGKVFDKWYFENGSGQEGYKNPGDIIEKIDVWYALWAVWKDAEYSISFDTKSLADTPSSISAGYNEIITLPSIKYGYYHSSNKKYGVEVVGWKDPQTLTVYPNGSNYAVTKSVTLSIETEGTPVPVYTVDFTGGGYDGNQSTGSMPQEEVLQGKNYVTPTTNGFTVTGAHFDDMWQLSQTGSNSWSSKKLYYEAGQAVENVLDNFILSPIWVGNGLYSVKFNLDGGTDDGDFTSINYRTNLAMNSTVALPLYTGTKEGYNFTGNWLVTDIATNTTVEVGMGGDYILKGNTIIKPQWREAGSYMYLLTNEIPSIAPSMSGFSTSTETNTLGNLEGWNNWKDKDNQYIVFPRQSGKTTIADYFELKDALVEGSLLSAFTVEPNPPSGLFIVKWDGFGPLTSDDFDATIMFK